MTVDDIKLASWVEGGYRSIIFNTPKRKRLFQEPFFSREESYPHYKTLMAIQVNIANILKKSASLKHDAHIGGSHIEVSDLFSPINVLECLSTERILYLAKNEHLYPNQKKYLDLLAQLKKQTVKLEKMLEDDGINLRAGEVLSEDVRLKAHENRAIDCSENEHNGIDDFFDDASYYLEDISPTTLISSYWKSLEYEVENSLVEYRYNKNSKGSARLLLIRWVTYSLLDFYSANGLSTYYVLESIKGVSFYSLVCYLVELLTNFRTTYSSTNARGEINTAIALWEKGKQVN